MRAPNMRLRQQTAAHFIAAQEQNKPSLMPLHRRAAGDLPRLRDVFTVEARDRLRDELVSAAQADARISAAALVGSLALGRGDRWSDIDLALCVDDNAERPAVIGEWTDWIYAEHGAVHHMDVCHGEALYRVFLLADTLQVDLSFWPATDFGAIGSGFRLLFGAAGKETSNPVPTAAELIGMAWLYALHARSSVARERVWQAEYMISGMRDQVLALACLRHDLPTVHGLGFDRLPQETTAAMVPALVRSLDISELKRAFAVVTEALLGEAEKADAALADRFAGPLRELAS